MTDKQMTMNECMTNQPSSRASEPSSRPSRRLTMGGSENLDSDTGDLQRHRHCVKAARHADRMYADIKIQSLYTVVDNWRI